MSGGPHRVLSRRRCTPRRRGHHDQCASMVFRGFRSDPADLAQRLGEHGVVGADAQQRRSTVVAGLERPMQHAFDVEPPAR